MDRRQQRPVEPRLGISAIAVHEPRWVIENGWFGEALPRKFARHTGIEARGISLDDEVTMAAHAVRQLQHETGCTLAACRGVFFVSPSLIPPTVARRHLLPHEAAAERPGEAARALVRRLGLRHCRSVGINWFCSGFSRALALVQRRWAPRLGLTPDDFLLVVVAGRISRITDFGCRQTGGLFGDQASATLVAPLASRRHPVHFEIVHADAERVPAEKPAFDFHRQPAVPVPLPDGGTRREADRLVYSLDGMAIAEIAPRAMAEAVARAVAARGIAPADVRFVVPHQAGTGIVRFTAMQLEAAGVGGEVINDLVRRTGNVSASSVPHALRHEWHRLTGLIACPTAAVGAPGRPEVTRGCVLLRATAAHDRQLPVAA
jgi:3-oxoacyl-[acyl-carrier-protein] synthase III